MLEEGRGHHRDIDVGMMAGAASTRGAACSPLFMKADLTGLDVVLGKLEQAQEAHGERFAPPTVLRRLVAQGRLGQKSGQGFYAYPQADADDSGPPTQVITLETRGDVAIAWLANGAAELDRAPGDPRPRRRLAGGEGRRRARARDRVGQPAAVLGRRRSRPSRRWTRRAAPSCWTRRTRCSASWDRGDRDHRRGQRAGLRRRLRAGDGLRRAHRRALGPPRPARDQARDHPGLRRDAAAAAPRGPGRARPSR